MLRIEFDSDPAALARRFVAAIDPASRPVLVPDVVLVPTLGVGAWLERLVAERYGVAALLEVSLGGRYIWRALERMIGDLPARSPFCPRIPTASRCARASPGSMPASDSRWRATSRVVSTGISRSGATGSHNGARGGWSTAPIRPSSTNAGSAGCGGSCSTSSPT